MVYKVFSLSESCKTRRRKWEPYHLGGVSSSTRLRHPRRQPPRKRQSACFPNNASPLFASTVQNAARSGVSRTAPYHHFKDKRELLCGIAEEGFRRFREVLHPPGLDQGREVNERRVQHFVKDYIEFATSQSEYYDLMFGSHLWKTEGLTETLTR